MNQRGEMIKGNKRQRKKRLKLFYKQLIGLSTATNEVCSTMRGLSESCFSIIEQVRKQIAPNLRLHAFKQKIAKRNYYLEAK